MSTTERIVSVLGNQASRPITDFILNKGAGAIFYVDGSNGSDDNDGLLWERAFATPQAACDAVATAQGQNDNAHLRNTVYLAPTGTSAAYAKITAQGNYTDFIGLGAPPQGNGTGIVVIGDAADGNAVVGSSRGNRWYNIRFEARNGAYCFNTALTLRCLWDECAFMGAISADTGPAAGIFCSNVFAGNIIQNCRFSDDDEALVYGIRLDDIGTDYSAMNNNTIRNNIIHASTCGIHFGTTKAAEGSVILDNIIASGGAGAGDHTLATGISITTTYGNVLVARNIICATDAISYTNYANKWVFDNKVINGTTPVTEPTLHGSA